MVYLIDIHRSLSIPTTYYDPNEITDTGLVDYNTQYHFSTLSQWQTRMSLISSSRSRKE